MKGLKRQSMARRMDISIWFTLVPLASKILSIKVLVGAGDGLLILVRMNTPVVYTLGCY
jgi:hypothetical protein